MIGPVTCMFGLLTHCALFMCSGKTAPGLDILVIIQSLTTELGGMSASCPAALDPEGYVEQFLEAYYPGLNVRQTGHKLLRLRVHPTAREVHLAFNAMALTLQPDEGIFTTWTQANFKDEDCEKIQKAKIKRLHSGYRCNRPRRARSTLMKATTNKRQPPTPTPTQGG